MSSAPRSWPRTQPNDQRHRKRSSVWKSCSPLPKRAGLRQCHAQPADQRCPDRQPPLTGDGARTLIINPAALAGESGPATVALRPAEGPATMLLPAQAGAGE